MSSDFNLTRKLTRENSPGFSEYYDYLDTAHDIIIMWAYSQGLTGLGLYSYKAGSIYFRDPSDNQHYLQLFILFSSQSKSENDVRVTYYRPNKNAESEYLDVFMENKLQLDGEETARDDF